MIYRVQTEIENRLNKMQPPEPTFQVWGHGKEAEMMQSALNMAFKSGYNQAVKEMKKFFEVK